MMNYRSMQTPMIGKLHNSDSGSDLVNLTMKTYPKICSEDYNLWSQIHIQ
jgi:hypothetical protein